jgi:hypothetical protein
MKCYLKWLLPAEKGLLMITDSKNGLLIVNLEGMIMQVEISSNDDHSNVSILCNILS